MPSPDTRRSVSQRDIDLSDDLGRPVGKLVCESESVHSGDEEMMANRRQTPRVKGRQVRDTAHQFRTAQRP